MILDQSVFFGVADVHDRHRDMRLDVDNMSYEVKSMAWFLGVYFPCLFSRFSNNAFFGL